MGFFWQEYGSGLPCHSPGDLPDPGIEPMSFTSPGLAWGFFTTRTTWEALQVLCYVIYYIDKQVNIQILDGKHIKVLTSM